MSSDSTWRGALRRGRAILVPATAASALVAGALVFAADASAATAPSLTLRMPANVSYNDNRTNPVTPIEHGSLRINNSQNGAQNLPVNGGDQLYVHFTITGPSGLQPGMVTMEYDSNDGMGLQPVTLHGSNGALTADIKQTPISGNPSDPSNDQTHDLTLDIDTTTSTSGPFEGSITTTADLEEFSGTGFVSTIATSNTETTNFVHKSAPSFGNAPSALVNNSYATQLEGPTFPEVTYSVVWNHTRPNGHVDHKTLSLGPDGNYHLLEATAPRPPSQTAECGPDGFTANQMESLCADSFTLHTDTGMLTANPQNLPQVDGLPVDNFTVTATNAVDSVTNTITLPVLFSDVAPNADFAKEIYTLTGQTIINGFSDGTFRPTMPITRQAFVHFAAGVIDLSVRAGNPVYGGPVATGTCSPLFNPSPFPDVANNSQFCAEIADLNSRGIINGFSDGTFRPAQLVSRQAIAAFVYRTDVDLKNLDPATASDAQCGSTPPFSDVPLSSQFCGDIQWGANNNIINGFANGTFQPTADASRQAGAAYLYRTEVLEGLQNQI